MAKTKKTTNPKDKRTYPVLRPNMEAYIKDYFKLNPFFKPCTYIVNGQEVVA